MPLTADDIQRAFAALSEELHRHAERAEIVVVGGAALVVLFGARESTKDVDAYFIRPEASVVRAAAATVAHRLNLPDDWLNDGAKAYLVTATTGDVIHESAALIVRAASTPQLLAMNSLRGVTQSIALTPNCSSLKCKGRRTTSGRRSNLFSHPATSTKPRMHLKIYGRRHMDLRELVSALLTGDLLTARQCVADARRADLRWEQVEYPSNLTAVELAVAAAVVELLASRAGSPAPAWTNTVGAVRELLVLDPGLDRMPRSFERAKSNGPEPLRKRNIVALPDFLDVA